MSLSQPMTSASDESRWYVMRDLKRHNALLPAYKELPELGFEVYTPLHTVIVTSRTGSKRRVERPVIPDLLFVHSPFDALDAAVRKIDTLQFRYVKGAPYRTPMVASSRDMERFIRVTTRGTGVRYYSPGELTEAMVGRQIRVVGGPLDGIKANLMSIRGLRHRRLVVDVDGLVAASVEINPEFIEFLS